MTISIALSPFLPFFLSACCAPPALLHISQMSNTKISDPSEVVSIGDPLFVKVIEIKVGNNVGTWSNFAHSLTRSHAHSFTLHSFTLSLLHSPILTHPLTHPLTYIWFSPWLQDDGKIAVSMKSVRQSDGTDTDPTNILIEQERLRKQKVTDNERPPLELGAVLNTVCAKCGLKGHFAKDCFSQGKQYSVVEANSEEEQLEDLLRHRAVQPHPTTATTTAAAAAAAAVGGRTTPGRAGPVHPPVRELGRVGARVVLQPV